MRQTTAGGVARQPAARRPRRVAWATTVVAIVVGIVGACALWAISGGKARTPSHCQVAFGSTRYLIDLEQAANATTISAVGKQLRMPDHARGHWVWLLAAWE